MMIEREQSPADTKSQALQIEQAWLNINQHASYGDLPLAEFTAGIDGLQAAETNLLDLEDLLTNARNQRMEQRYALWQAVKQARTGAKAKHGDDSDEYERFGGTRTSERK